MTSRDVSAASRRDSEALNDAGEYLVAGPKTVAQWWEHLGDAHRDYAALARIAVAQAAVLNELRGAYEDFYSSDGPERLHRLLNAEKLVRDVSYG